MRRAPLLVLLVASSACWSLTSTVPDVTGGIDGQTPIPEGGTTDPDGGTTDGASLESGTDAGDGGPGTDGGDGGGTYCAMFGAGSFLCDDFTTGAQSPAWTQIDQGMGGSVAFVDGTFIARVRQPCAGGFGQLVHAVPKKTANAHVAFSFRAAALPGNATNHVAGFTHLISGGFYRVDLATVFDHLEIIENVSGTVTPHVSGALSLSSTKRIELTVDFVAKNVLVKLDGVQVISDAIQAPVPTADETRFELGVYAGDSCPGAVDFVFDDFTYVRQDR